MNKEPLASQYEGEKLYTIGTVSKLTGVGSITLRAWERRYELIEPVRKKSGHRLYTRRHIDQINRITALTNQGIRISQIQPHMLASVQANDSENIQSTDSWRSYLDSLIAAILSFDEDRMEEIYNEALSLYPIEMVTRKLLGPLLVELGLRWQNRKGSVAEEHFFAFYLRNKLGARFHHRTKNNKGPKLLLAGLPGQFHEIALLLFSLAASEKGFQLISLGANMPFDELTGVAAKTDVDALVLSGAIEPGKKLIETDLKVLVDQCRVPVFIGGQASVFACNAINKSGAIALGNDIELGLRRMEEHLSQAENSKSG